MTTRAVLSLDYINEIVAPGGKLAGKGYASFCERHGTLDRVHQLLSRARESNVPVLHVRVGFSPSYAEHPEMSPLFGVAKKFGALTLGTPATEFHPKASPKAGEVVLTKHRVSAFHGTPLDLILRNLGIRELFVVGVATDMAVQSAVRDAHDRDYNVTIISDACAAATDEDHEHALRLLGKVSSVKKLEEISF